MRESLNRLNPQIKDLIRLASKVAIDSGMSAYLVGGFVRDLILRMSNFDLDIVIEDDGIGFAERLSEILNAQIIRHRRFGTATIIRQNHIKIDIATARSEFYPEPASLPVVKRGNLKDDLARRDFTINAMALSINRKDYGRLVDFFGGMKDLKNKKIRILHSLSFIDDPTRILRAIRFERRFNFKIEADTLAYLKEAVKKNMLERVQPQRLRDELMLILKEKEPLREIKRIDELAGFSFLCRNLRIRPNTYKLLNSVENQIKWFKSTYPKRRHLDIWLIYLLGLTDSLNIREAKSVCKRFLFHKGEEKRILSYKKLSRKFIQELNRQSIRPSKIFNLIEPLSYEVIILIKAKYKNPNLNKHIKDFLDIYSDLRVLVSGEDLQKLGFVPGPYYQKIFAKILKAKLEGTIKTKDEELYLIKKLIKTK